MIYTDLWAYELSENPIGGQSGPRTQWIQFLPRGRYKHPKFGWLDLDDKLFNELKSNFDNKVRLIDPAMDRDHAPDGNTEALGWFKATEIRDDGFWVLVEYTPLGETLVHQTKQFRYFSPEWGPYDDAASEKHFDNVISGGAATNRPFLKELAPLAASERWFEGDSGSTETAPTIQLKAKKNKKSKQMGSAVCQVCGSAEASQVCTNCGYQMTDKNTETPAEPAVEAPKPSKRLTEVEETNKKLTDTVSKMTETISALERQLKEETVARQLREWESVKVDVKLTDAAGEETETKTLTRAISPKLAEMYRKVILGDTEGETLTLKDFIDEGIRGGFVQLGEIGEPLNPQAPAPDASGPRSSVSRDGVDYAVEGEDIVRMAEEYAKAQGKDFNDPVVKLTAMSAVSKKAPADRRSY